MRHWILRTGILLMLAVAGASLRAAAPELLKFVPAGTEYLVSVNLERLREVPGLRAALESNEEVASRLSEFENTYNLKLEECRQLMFAGGGKRLRGMLVATEVPEARLSSTLAALPGGRYSAAAAGERKVHYVTADRSVPEERVKLALCYLDAGSVLATEEPYLAHFLEGLKTDSAIRLAAVEVPAGNPVIWGFLNVRSLTAGNKRKASLFQVFFRDLRRVVWEIASGGEHGGALTLSATGTCRNEQSAALLNASLPGYLAMAANLLFAAEPALGGQVVNSLKSRVDGKKVYAELKLSEELTSSIGRYLKREAERRMMPPDPVPADQRNR